MPIVENPQKVIAASFGPKGFHWLIPGLLGGTALPTEYEALQQVGTTLLVSLTEEWHPDVERIEQCGMHSLYVPIADFHPPSIPQALHACEVVSAYTEHGRAVVFHCQAGKGRTGTMLAAVLIWAGQTADDAIAETRAKNAAWIETEGQLAFLKRFAEALA